MARSPQPRAYRDGDPDSWAVGRYAVAELLRLRPDLVREVVLHGDLEPERAAALERAAAAAGARCRRDDARVERARRKGDARAAARFDARALERDLDGEVDHLLLVAPDHFGNVGTTLRSMLAFGTRDLALVAPRLPPAHPHVVRASIGAVFGVRARRFASVDAYRARHRRPLYALDGSARLELGAVRFARPCTLAFGPERTPRPEERIAADLRIRIAHDAAVESLNLAVAAGIALHALAEQRRAS